ncbi:phosphodiester glycosidase family protein [Streptomyces sp. NPDC091268]|uniref:phosphodiester glycosidase family protein n=1 Tax=Streptomyces sp. NPDC091268 TaxID=3365979 RepID=UPI003807E78D
MAKTTRSTGRPRMRRVAAVSAALATLALTQSTANGVETADTLPDPVISVLDGLTPHPLTVADGVERTTYSSDTSDIVVRVAVIDPDKGAVSVNSTFGKAVGVKETTTAMLNTVKEVPYVGINGGFSVSTKDEDANGAIIHEDRSIPMMTSVQEDVVQGAACMNGQNSVVLQHGRPHFTRVKTSLTITSDKKTAGAADDVTRIVDGVNRYPGWIPFCQQEPTDKALPVKRDADGNPVKDEDGNYIRLDENGRAIKSAPHYQDDSEIVVFTSAYGQKTPTPAHTPFVAADNAQGVEVAVDKDGYVTAMSSTRGGMDIPANGMVLQGIGLTQADAGAKWLTDNIAVGTKLTYNQSVTDVGFTEETTDDEDIPLNPAYPSVDVVNGTHQLMRDGKVVAPTDGNARLDPRTAIGSDGYGRTLFVTVSAKADNARLGVGIYDMAKLMQDLGAIDALNLDGGGSTTFVVDGVVKNELADNGVERPVYDSVYAGRGGFGLPAAGN